MDCEGIPNEIIGLVKKGYELIASDTHPKATFEFERHRIIARKWRTLIGEARFDIPTALHRYVNWLMPEEWVELAEPHKKKNHSFFIEIPNFAVIKISYQYREFWFFDKFEITGYQSPLSSDSYYDLPIMLAIARELKRPKAEKQKVTIEEIEGELADNAKCVKVNVSKFSNDDVKLNIPKSSGYIMTREDFLNNPDADVDADAENFNRITYGYDY